MLPPPTSRGLLLDRVQLYCFLRSRPLHHFIISAAAHWHRACAHSAHIAQATALRAVMRAARALPCTRTPRTQAVYTPWPGVAGARVPNAGVHGVSTAAAPQARAYAHACRSAGDGGAGVGAERTICEPQYTPASQVLRQRSAAYTSRAPAVATPGQPVPLRQSVCSLCAAQGDPAHVPTTPRRGARGVGCTVCVGACHVGWRAAPSLVCCRRQPPVSMLLAPRAPCEYRGRGPLLHARTDSAALCRTDGAGGQVR